MNSIEYWIEYKKYVYKLIPPNIDRAKVPVVLTYGLSKGIADLFDSVRQEILAGKDPESTSKIPKIADVLEQLVLIELFYNLPYPRYVNYIGIAFEMDASAQINIVETQSEALTCASNISLYMVQNGQDEIQYNLNKLLGTLFDVCLAFGLSIIDVIKESITRIDKKYNTNTPAPVNNNPEIYKIAYNKTKDFIKTKNVEEIVFKLKLRKRNKNPYKGIEVKAFGESTLFYNGDIITDFFQASNFVGETYKDKTYIVNYNPDFRKLLNEQVSTLYMGYIYEKEIFTTEEMRNIMKNKTKDNVMFLGKEGRPILMTPKIKKIEDLYDHVNAVKKAKTVN
jgi:hypothetical protein